MEESIEKKPASLKDFKKEKVNFSSWLRKHAPFSTGKARFTSAFSCLLWLFFGPLISFLRIPERA